jgi:hypothetical protein
MTVFAASLMFRVVTKMATIVVVLLAVFSATVLAYPEPGKWISKADTVNCSHFLYL